MTVFVIKILAVITMILDHIKYAIPITNCFFTQCFGRISFPLFAFLISESIIHTKSRKKYIGRIAIFAIISQIPFMLFRSLVADYFMLNIMFTFLFSILGILVIDFFKSQKEISIILKYIITSFSLFSIMMLGSFIPVDYRWFGILTVWIFYIFREKKILRTIIFIFEVVIYYFVGNGYNFSNVNFFSVIFTILPSLIILFYNGKQGKKLKYFFYWFYPIHMLIIYFLSFIFK